MIDKTQAFLADLMALETKYECELVVENQTEDLLLWSDPCIQVVSDCGTYSRWLRPTKEDD